MTQTFQILRRQTAVVCALAVILIALCVFFVDRPLSVALRALPSPVVDGFRAITDIAKAEFWIVGSFLLAVYCWVRRRDAPGNAQAQRWFRLAIFVFAALVLSGIATDILKLLLCRSRPVMLASQNLYGFFPFHRMDARFESMPSGHADTAVVLALLARRFWPRYAPYVLVFAALMIISRLAVEAHYLGDVLAGALIGWLTTRWLIAIGEERGWIPRS